MANRCRQSWNQGTSSDVFAIIQERDNDGFQGGGVMLSWLLNVLRLEPTARGVKGKSKMCGLSN